MTASAPPPVAGVLAASAIRQSLIPMLVFYLIFMAALGLGLLRLQRIRRPGPPPGTPHPGNAAGSRQDVRRRQPGTSRSWQQDISGPSRGWWVMTRQVGVIVVAGYLLLLVVDFGYYFAIARVSGDFLLSAVTGPALLVGLSMPLYAVATWLLLARHRRHSGDG